MGLNWDTCSGWFDMTFHLTNGHVTGPINEATRSLLNAMSDESQLWAGRGYPQQRGLTWRDQLISGNSGLVMVLNTLGYVAVTH